MIFDFEVSFNVNGDLAIDLVSNLILQPPYPLDLIIILLLELQVLLPIRVLDILEPVSHTMFSISLVELFQMLQLFSQ